jgi:pimeloyl-ACP methyl ester carboxylesterase
VPLLEEAKHDAIAVDLPGDDEQAGLSAYSDRVVEAIGTRLVVLVAQSLGGFTAPLVCAQVRVRMLVFVASPSSLSSRTFTLATSNLGQRLSSTGDVRGALAAAPRPFPWTVSMVALAWSGRAQVMRYRCLTGRPRTTLASGRHLFRAQSVDSGRCGS